MSRNEKLFLIVLGVGSVLSCIQRIHWIGSAMVLCAFVWVTGDSIIHAIKQKRRERK